MKKIFTLVAMAFVAMSMNAQTTITWVDGTENWLYNESSG